MRVIIASISNERSVIIASVSNGDRVPIKEPHDNAMRVIIASVSNGDRVPINEPYDNAERVIIASIPYEGHDAIKGRMIMKIVVRVGIENRWI